MVLNVAYSRTYEVRDGDNPLGLFITFAIQVTDSCRTLNPVSVQQGNGGDSSNDGWEVKNLADKSVGFFAVSVESADPSTDPWQTAYE